MGQTHYTSRPLPFGNESSVRWATRPAGRAVIFVHGFGGEAQATWDQFSTLLPLQPQCDGRDLFFYGYDSLVQQATVSAADFLSFLQGLATDPYTSAVAPTLADARRSDPQFQYQHITLVAHSLGAVVVREALVQAAMEEPPAAWLDRVALVLFAPAHSGAQVIELAKEALGAMPANVGDIVTAGIEGYAQVLNDLKPESPALKRLQEDTHRLIQEGHRSLRAKVVVIGKKDRIVSAVRFCSDPGPRVVEGKGHIGICKPDAGYSIPLGHLLPHI